MGGYLLLNGDLDIDILRKAFNYVIAKYDALRLRFVTIDGELFQKFVPEYQFDIEYIDFRNKENPHDEAVQFLVKENARPFPFENVTLFREMVLQTGEKQFVLFPRFHHFSNDGYGKSIVNQAISDTYNRLLADGSFPELHSYSYLDFLEDDNRYRESDTLKNSSEFWREKLMPLPEPLDFTAKKHGIKNFSLHHERVTLNLHRICYASILKIADEVEVTPFHALLGIFYTTLNKLYNRNDIVIGMPVLNRSNYKFRNTPGLFMNMIPLRVHLASEWTFKDILSAIKTEVKESYRHQRVPLSELYKYFRNNPEFKNELFDITFVYRKMDFSQKFGKAKLNSVTLDTQIRNESLSIEVDEYDNDENVNIFFNYNPLVFSELEAIQFAKCFEAVLFELIYFPEKSIADVKFISVFEQHKILKTFNSNGEVKHTDKTIVGKFEDCTRSYPYKTSIFKNEESITYHELNAKANQIANCLIEQRNISKGDIVCMVAERSIDAIAAMLGIMKTGAVYLPVDGHNPRDRIEFILGNSHAKMLVTDNQKYNDLSDNVVLLNEIENSNISNPSVEIYIEDLAYIIYTSGSTGSPKGVMIEHGSFMNMFVNMIGIFGVSETDRVLQFASFGFDAAVFEIFQALLTGAVLVILEKEIIQNPNSFIQQMNEKRITVATMPPAYLNALDKPEFPHLITLISAGEPAVVSDVNHYKKSVRFINGYGPTEASVCASYYLAEKEKEYQDSMPIGKTVPGSSIYILNANLEPLPIGFPGELCISGPSLARGYLNNKELTDQKFVANPFEENRRMYRTGDRARFLPDGNIEFIGRIDDQIKIKGNRIELGEIENRIKKYPLVKDVVALDFETNCNKNIAAFVSGDQEIDLFTLKKFLLEFLPEYMMPQHISFVEKFPLTHNGKIDKRELRKMVSATPPEIHDHSSEPTELEQKLIPIFELVLECKPIGVNDNFFEMGGESLKIARLITRIKKELQLEINFKAIFDKPTVRGLASELALINIGQYCEIEASPVKEFYPLSHAQKRLWILSQDKGNASVYNMPVPLLLEGRVNLQCLKQAIHAIVERHEVLRTIFIDVEGTPCQKVLATPDFIIKEYDVSLDKDAANKADVFINQEVMTPFDLSCEIPVRAQIVKIEEGKYVFLVVIHHIAGDGISIGIIMNELSQLYNSFDTGDQKLVLKPLKIQYKDYCVHEQTLLESEAYLKEKDYWLKTLSDPIPVLHLPTDRMRPPIKTYQGKYLFSEIDEQLRNNMLAFGKDNSVSPFMVLLASVNILLHKYTSDEDIIIGSPVAGRNHQELENQVGLYLNTVAIRNHICSGDSFRDFLLDVKNKSSEAFSNSNYPFDSLIRNLNLERDTSRAPLFDVLVQYQNQDATILKLNDVKSSFYQVDFTSNKFDLIFTFTENEGEIAFSIGYNTNLFNSGRIERTSRHLKNTLSRVLAKPDIFIKEINILDKAEESQLLLMSEGPRLKLDGKSVIDLFEEQVHSTPDNPALVFNLLKLSYKQLDQRVNGVANEILNRISVAPDDIIAIMAPRSELMVIGILGILKTGAAYLPITLDLPKERAKFMLSDSRTKLLLTETSLIAQAEEILSLANPCLVNKIALLDITSIENPSGKTPTTKIHNSSLAYLLYTSGSTGMPKGVMIEHHSLYNLVLGLSNGIYGNVSAPLNIALISPFVFDASVKQIFYALGFGHCLDIVPDETKASGRKLLTYYKDHQINVSDGTPIHLEIIVDELSLGKETYLPERFVIGGEQLMHQPVKSFFERIGTNSPIVTNVYGPTECCDVATYFSITREYFRKADAAFNYIPVGQPINNVQVDILDSNLSPVPIGVNGELYIAGEGLSRGYINRPELSEERFLEVDFVPGKRIYKTGDIGRFLDDGSIILSGRADDQIKLRGFRIELAEIENCLRNFPNVNSSTVIAVGEDNEKGIAAYYTAAEKIEHDDVKHFLSLHLPDYMIPSYFIQLENIPVTINGKVDKKSLPVPVKEISSEESLKIQGDMLEEKLCKIWKELLHINHVNPTDNFFKLGGHSLIAIRLVSKIHKEFNIEINIWEVFQHATISSLAKLLTSKNPSLFNPIEKIEKGEYYPLSHAQRRLWFLAKLEGHNSLYNLPAALHMKGKVNAHVLEDVFKAIVQRHESLRTYFVEIDGEPFQKIADTIDLKIEIANYTGPAWDKNRLKELAVEYFNYEFDLSRVPLLKIKLICLSEDNYLFLFNMHHIISDGWSIEVMLKEFETYYNSFLNNLEDPLQPLRIQYKDYATWQNKILGEESLGVVKDYWQKKLSKPRPLLNLPADYSRSESFTMDGDMLQYSIDDAQAKALKDIGSGLNASLYMTLLSAVYILLHKYTGEEDIMVGSPVAGRQHYDLENQVGFFINTIVLRNEINPEHTFEELLVKVKETLAGAFDNQVYPFDRLVDELDVERIQNRNPLFDVMVAWMVKNGMGMKLQFSGIEADGLDFRISSSMFDLSFLFDENEGKVEFAIEYNTSLFRKERIQNMSVHFRKLLESITANPKEKIKNLEIIPTSEKEKLLFEFNKQNHLLTAEKNVIDLFNHQAQTNGNNLALVCEGRELNYEELASLSNRIANTLLERIALNREDIVAVVVDDPVLSVASILAIMKTGAAYLPISSDTPSERIAYILRDSCSKAVLVDSHLLDGNTGTGPDTISETVILDISGPKSENQSSPKKIIEPNSLAYVIYTSGSTGVPKGVMVEHQALSNLIASLSHNFIAYRDNSLNELMINSFAFDVSLKQIFATLCHGNTLHLLNKDRRLDPREIIIYIVDSKINIIDITPSLFSVMLEEGFCEIGKPDLKEIFIGSEALPVKLVNAFYSNDRNKVINITNFYGPTECCVESSYFRFDPENPVEKIDIAPIGKPVLNEQIYILDKDLNLCPIGIPGEISIAGKGLARQYLNDPDRTNEKFVQFPLLGGTRIYKTGDIGRTRQDGNIEFLGRLDEQVKIRGYRVELQEIEKQLREVKEIIACAVTLFEKNGSSELAAYFTSDVAIDPMQLKNHLDRVLPKYMVPSYFIQLDKIPISSNGKTDKKLLPDPTGFRESVILRKPQDEYEFLILRICSDVLKKEEISLGDNFFEIGGHSLNAVRVISQIQKELKIDLALKEIFYTPVLLDIAEKVKKLIESKESFGEKDEEETLIVPVSDDELEFLSNIQFEDDDE
jgi:fengycin family lipopeptide synthetase D